MKLNLRWLQLARRYPGEFRRGKWKSNRIHVGSRPHTILKECFRSIHPAHRGRLAVNAQGQPLKPARWAYYLGAVLGVRAGLRLCRQFRL